MTSLYKKDVLAARYENPLEDDEHKPFRSKIKLKTSPDKSQDIKIK